MVITHSDSEKFAEDFKFEAHYCNVILANFLYFAHVCHFQSGQNHSK